MSASSRIPVLPDEVRAKKSIAGWNMFTEAARTAISRWDLIRTAVFEEWGGRSSKAKFEHMLEDLLLNCQEQWRDGHDLHEDTLDVYFIECLTADFNIDFEDDSSVTALSLVLQSLYRKCAAGDTAGVQALLASLDTRPDFNPDPAARARAAAGDSSEDDGSDEGGSGSEGGGAGAGSGGDGAGRRTRQVDDDGWETVPVKGKGKGGGGGSGPASGGGAGMDES